MYCHTLLGDWLQVSRLQSGEDVMRSVLEQARGELRQPISEYGLFWPEQKVTLATNILCTHLIGLSRMTG